MFDEYAKKLEALGENVPKIFDKVAKKSAINARNYAVETTDRLGLVDTGAYRRSWNGEAFNIDENTYGVALQNTMEYASFIEDGYEIRRPHFVPFDKLQGTPKANAIISSFKKKYPNAKGFIAKPRRFKAQKVGQIALNDTEGFALLELRKEIDVAMKAKELGISKSEVRKMM